MKIHFVLVDFENVQPGNVSLLRNILCQRSKSIAEIPLVKVLRYDAIPEKVDAVTDNLVRLKAAKPGTVKALRSTIKALFAKQLADEEIDGLIEQLTKRGAIKLLKAKRTMSYD